MAVLGTIAAFLAVLVVLVLVHELGHFIVAKRAGITVQEFGIGFPPRIGSVIWRGTRYSLNWIPLGGFVKMLGEDGEAEEDRLRRDGLSEAQIELAMAGAFNRKPIPVRILVLLAGVFMNFLLAAAMFAAALSLPAQVGHGPLTVSEVQPNSPAQGKLEVGDRIVSADGRSFTDGALDRSRDLTAYVASRAGKEVVLGVVRDGKQLDVTVVPRALTDEQRAQGLGSIGFMYEPERIVEEPSPVDSPVKAIGEGTAAAWGLAIRIPGGLAEAVGGLIGLNPSAADSARGPIGIAEETGRVLEAPLVSQLLFVGVLSINLAVLNVLPFPPLDGGRIAVVLIEAIRRRRLPAEREALIYLTGFAVLIALVILISIQDVSRLLGG
jgi:regulator of sigma E protease